MITKEQPTAKIIQLANRTKTPVMTVVTGVMTAKTPRHDGDDGVTVIMAAIKSAERRLLSSARIKRLRDENPPQKAAAILTGALMMARHIKPGELLNATDIIKSCVTVTISYRLLNDKCKPLMIESGIWKKNTSGKFHWVNWKNPTQCTNDVQTPVVNVQMEQMACANAVQMAAISVQMQVTCNE